MLEEGDCVKWLLLLLVVAGFFAWCPARPC